MQHIDPGAINSARKGRPPPSSTSHKKEQGWLESHRIIILYFMFVGYYFYQLRNSIKDNL